MKDCSNCGKLMIMIGLLIMVPVCILLVYPQDAGQAGFFLIPGLISVLFGAAVCCFGKRENHFNTSRMTAQKHSNNTVLFTWFWGIVAGAVPFYISGQLTPVQALFESVSGWTTTGLSAMDVSQTSHIFLFYRSFMQYCGGLGFVMMMIMLISGKRSMDLFNAEGHPDKLMPNLKRTAQIIFQMYLIFLALGTAAYVLCGMPLFDSICHAMCSLSTGGFSTKLNSIGEYHSFATEMVTIVLMLIGTTNFAVLLLLLQRKWRQVFAVSEVRFMFLLLAIFVPIMAVSLMAELGLGFWEGIRHALFNAASALSTTGYATMPYDTWPSCTVGLMILLMLVGGGFGSTAGGLKLTRVYLMLRLVGQNIKRKVLPQRLVDAPVYVRAQGRTKIDDEISLDTVGFVGCYLLLFVAGTLLITITAGCNLETAMFEFASALGTVGLSIGLTGPATNSATLIVEMIGMILGRLEIFIVLTGIWGAAHKVRSAFEKQQRR